MHVTCKHFCPVTILVSYIKGFVVLKKSIQTYLDCLEYLFVLFFNHFVDL